MDPTRNGRTKGGSEKGRARPLARSVRTVSESAGPQTEKKKSSDGKEQDQAKRAKFSKNKKERTAARKHGLSGGCLSVRRVEVLIPILFCVSAGSIFGSSEPYDGGSLCAHDPLQLPGRPETAMPARIRPLTFQQDFMPGRTLNLFRPFYAVDRFGAAEAFPDRPGPAPALPVGKAGQRGGQGQFLSRLRDVKAPRKIFFRKLVKSGRICLRLCYNRSEICEQMFS